MSAAASVVRSQNPDCKAYECPNPTCRALLWWTPCERCGGHYECDTCGDVFILKHDGWYRLMPRFDTLEKVGA